VAGAVHFRSVSASDKLENPALKCEAEGVLAFGNSQMFAPNPNRPLRQTLMLSLVVIGAAALGAVVLYGVTSWLGVVVHQGLR
jgi:multisubunit Na+/H+ antiporter MnhC subunit